MAWLSDGAEALVADLASGTADFDAVVVGSGYGGAVAACRLAEAGYKVCVLERGEEYLPGDFPNDLSSLPRHIRIQRADRPGVIGPRGGLFDIRLHGTVTTLVGAALGGTSQINANVALEADPESFKAGWPKALANGVQARHYEKVRQMLGVAPYPKDRRCAKAEALSKLERPGVRFFYPPLAVNYVDGQVSSGGVAQQGCIGCGDCVTGCNAGAKNTLTMNYLPHAYRNGARFYTGATVLAVDPRARDAATLYFTYTDYDPSRLKLVEGEAGLFKITAKLVVLAAGALGSTEILLRSRDHGFLPRLEKLGKRFSGNGDGLHFGFDQREEVNAVGWGGDAARKKDAGEPTPGPSIVGALDVKGAPGERMLIEDGIVPGALAHAAHEMLTTAGFFARLGSWKLKRDAQGSDPLALDRPALRRTQVYLTMGHDSGRGVIEPKNGSAYVTWKGAAAESFVRRQEESLRPIEKILDATYLRNPALQPLPEALRSLAPDQELEGTTLVVHPLGGCPMGDDAATGVVDHLGAVYDGEGSTYGTLYVWDGSIVPTSLGANPFLTIAALAERAVEALIERRPAFAAPARRELAALPKATLPELEPQDTTLQLKETMRGRLALPGVEKPADAALRLQMPVPRLADFLGSPDRIIHGITGTLDCPELAATPLEVVDGTMELFAREQRSLVSKIIRTCRAIVTWYRKRGHVEIPQFFREWKEGKASATGSRSLRQLIKGMFVLAYHASEERQLRYTLRLRDKAGTSYALRGAKRVRFALDSNVWDSLLDLPLTLEREGRFAGEGRFRLDLLSLSEDTLPQIKGAVDLPNALAHLASLPLLFLRVMLKLHLWDFRAPDYRDAAAPKPSPLVPSVDFPAGHRLEAEVHDIAVPYGSLARDSETIGLRLTRFRTSSWLGDVEDAQGTPILLLHGYAQSSRAFAAHMLPEDLIRHLLARNFDVWLLDYRTSTALVTAREQCSLDDVARHDIPHAVEFILGKVAPGRPNAQIMAFGHCMGAATLAMSLLGGWLKHESGLPKIRAAILSQVPPFIVGGYYSQYREALAAFARNALGVQHLDFAADSGAGPWEKLMDRIFATLPVAVEREPYGARIPEDCRSIPHHEPRTDIATCRRVSGIIGPLYLHRNVRHTHHHLHEWFGVGSISILAHVAKFFQYERLVSADGANFYVTDANIFTNLQLPIGLLHGNRNQVFDPESAQRSCMEINRVRGPGACQVLDIGDKDYAHFDCLIGDRAYLEVYPKISEFFLNQLRLEFGEGRRPRRARSDDTEPFPYRPAPQDRPASGLDQRP